MVAVGPDLDAPAGADGARRRGLRGRPGSGRPAHPPAPAGPRGGRDGRDRGPGRRPRRVHRGGGHAQHRPGHRLGRRRRARCSSWAARRLAEVAVAGAITVGRAGERLAPDGASWPRSGCASSPTTAPGSRTAGLMRRALEYARGLGVTLAQHCEDDAPGRRRRHARGGWSSRLGIPGHAGRGRGGHGGPRPRPGPARPARRVHFLHLSTAGSVDLVRRAKAEGLAVTAEAAPHHFTLTDAELAGYDPVFKVNPPLRTDDDVAAVKAGLADGTIDAIATDHAPHAPEAKDAPLRPGAAGHARPGDGPGPGPHRARTCPSSRGSWPSSAGSRPPSPASTGPATRHRPGPAGARRTGGRRGRRPTSASSTPPPLDRRPARPWPAAAATRPTPGGP